MKDLKDLVNRFPKGKVELILLYLYMDFSIDLKLSDLICLNRIYVAQKTFSKFFILSTFIQLFLFFFASFIIAEILDFVFERINGEDVFILNFSNYNVQEIFLEVVF